MQRDTFKKISRIYAGLRQLYEQDVVLRLHSAPTTSPIRNHGGSGLRLGCARGFVCLNGERASPRKAS